jgi:hypothetical protein
MQTIIKEIVLSNIIINNKFKPYDYSFCIELTKTISNAKRWTIEDRKTIFNTLNTVNLKFNNSIGFNSDYTKNKTEELIKIILNINENNIMFIKSNKFDHEIMDFYEINALQTKDCIGIIMNKPQYSQYKLSDLYGYACKEYYSTAYIPITNYALNVYVGKKNDNCNRKKLWTELFG